MGWTVLMLHLAGPAPRGCRQRWSSQSGLRDVDGDAHDVDLAAQLLQQQADIGFLVGIVLEAGDELLGLLKRFMEREKGGKGHGTSSARNGRGGDYFPGG
jgi:hypothetical protein